MLLLKVKYISHWIFLRTYFYCIFFFAVSWLPVVSRWATVCRCWWCPPPSWGEACASTSLRRTIRRSKVPSLPAKNNHCTPSKLNRKTSRKLKCRPQIVEADRKSPNPHPRFTSRLERLGNRRLDSSPSWARSNRKRIPVPRKKRLLHQLKWPAQQKSTRWTLPILQRLSLQKTKLPRLPNQNLPAENRRIVKALSRIWFLSTPQSQLPELRAGWPLGERALHPHLSIQALRKSRRSASYPLLLEDQHVCRWPNFNLNFFLYFLYHFDFFFIPKPYMMGYHWCIKRLNQNKEIDPQYVLIYVEN